MKRLLVLGFIFVLLLAIPLTLFLLGQQTKTRSGASPATTLIFSSKADLNNVNVGDKFALDLGLNPGSGGSTNIISFINLNIQYSSNLALDTTKGDNNSGVTIYPVNGKSLVILTPLSSPQCGAATCVITLSLGVNPGDQGINTAIPALITLYMVANSPSNPNSSSTVDVSNSKIYSTGQNDQPSDNVLINSGTEIATINVTAPSGTPTPTTTDTPTDTPGPNTPTDTPGGGGGGGNATDTPTDTPTGTQGSGGGNATDTPTDTPTGTQGSGGGTGTATTPVCTSLAADTLSGPSPLNVNFTATGNDANGSVSKITYNFGDGQVQDITSGSGIGTTVVNSQVAHTYNSDGTYTASVSITDSGGGVSDPGSCSKTITVGNGGPTLTSTPTTGATAVAQGPTTAPTIPASGPGNTIVNVGIIGGVLSIIGAILIFAL